VNVVLCGASGSLDTEFRFFDEAEGLVSCAVDLQRQSKGKRKR
jgi:hypothetical protein